jgi:hypothetical protein
MAKGWDQVAQVAAPAVSMAIKVTPSRHKGLRFTKVADLQFIKEGSNRGFQVAVTCHRLQLIDISLLLISLSISCRLDRDRAIARGVRRLRGRAVGIMEVPHSSKGSHPGHRGLLNHRVGHGHTPHGQHHTTQHHPVAGES